MNRSLRYQPREGVYTLIDLERSRQDQMFPDDDFNANPPSVNYLVLAEEAGEVATAILEMDDANLKDELVQVAAVCVKWLESIEETENRNEDRRSRQEFGR